MNLGRSIAMENSWCGVIDAVDDRDMSGIHLQVDFILSSIQVLEQVRPVVQSNAQ